MGDETAVLQNSHEEFRQGGESESLIPEGYYLAAGEVDGDGLAFLDLIRRFS